MKDSLLVGFLHRADSISPQFGRSLTMALVRDAMTTQRVYGQLDQESSANISAGRCSIVERFLAHSARPDWLWMVDSDMTFPPDIIDRLLEVADRQARPIVGGLCFGVRPLKIDGEERMTECGASPLELFPTLYLLDDEGRMAHLTQYEPNSVMQVASTGAACLLIHRSVLADKRWTEDGHPLPWFRESVLHGKVCSEDHFFCLKAGSFGFPVHVNTAARTGHVKTFIADEVMFLAQQAGRASTAPVEVSA